MGISGVCQIILTFCNQHCNNSITYTDNDVDTASRYHLKAYRNVIMRRRRQHEGVLKMRVKPVLYHKMTNSAWRGRLGGGRWCSSRQFSGRGCSSRRISSRRSALVKASDVDAASRLHLKGIQKRHYDEAKTSSNGAKDERKDIVLP